LAAPITIEEHRAWLAGQAQLPLGFRVGTASLDFVPAEAASCPASMGLTLLALDRPTPDFAMVFTRNAFPGAPVIIGRQRLTGPTLGAVIINNKIANVCVPGGVQAAETICGGVAAALGLQPGQVLPCSTGIIGWRLPVGPMLDAVPKAVAALQALSALPAATGIMTTDLYPKVRRVQVGRGSVVGIAKGAGMIEPHMATMLAFLLTDLAVPREHLRAALARAVDHSFNRISIDSDTSTSDTVVALSSGAVPVADRNTALAAIEAVCGALAEDIVRNGEGVHHVIRATVRGCPYEAMACGIGRAIVNSPLVKTAVCSNDPNVGRLVAAAGKFLGLHAPGVDLSRTSMRLGGHVFFEQGTLVVNAATEAALGAHLKGAELYAEPPAPRFPLHERRVELEVDLAAGPASATILGGDLSHEYISENADYRS
jgi:glutamate N-acetyltransferase/amino-acid N-acetyltransferase